MRLHREHGANPRLTFCPQCGGEGDEIVLLGDNDGLYRCVNCEQVHIGRPDGRKCRECGAYVDFERTIGQNERIPGSTCGACLERNRAIHDEVSRGGVHWRCADCGSSGAIRADHPLSIAARAQMGIAPPDPCGVEFTRADGCPMCGSEGEGHEPE